MKIFAARMSIKIKIIINENDELPNFGKFIKDYVVNDLTTDIFEREALKEWFYWYLNKHPYSYQITKQSAIDHDLRGAHVYYFNFPKAIFFRSNCQIWPKNPISKDIIKTDFKNGKIAAKYQLYFDKFVVVETSEGTVRRFFNCLPLSLLPSPFISTMFNCNKG